MNIKCVARSRSIERSLVGRALRTFVPLTLLLVPELARAQAPAPAKPAPAKAEPANAEPEPQPAAPEQPEVKPAPEAEKPEPADRGPAPRDARGLEKPNTDPSDIGLFIPRVVLFPVKLVTQLVFLPVRHGLRFVQRHAVVERVIDVLYNDERTAAIVPTFQFISAYGPTVGVKAFHENMAGHGEKGEIAVQAGGVYNLGAEVGFSGNRIGGSRLFLSSMVRYDARPRLLFQGIGDNLPVSSGGPGLDPRTADIETRFNQDRLLVSQGAGYSIGQPGNLVKIGGQALYNHRTFDRNTTDDRSIETAYDTSKLVGFADGANTLELDATLTVDTRDSEAAPSSGMFVDMFAGGVPPVNRYRYGHWGAEVTGFIDLYKKTRVLVLRGGIEAVEGSDDRIPFSSLPRLGGPTRLRGYRLDRFRDEKTALATVEYQYPIHEILSGALFVDAGRVANNYERLTELGNWRVGVGAGLRVRTKDHSLFALDLAYGKDGVLVFFTTTPLRAFSKRETQL